MFTTNAARLAGMVVLAVGIAAGSAGEAGAQPADFGRQRPALGTGGAVERVPRRHDCVGVGVSVRPSTAAGWTVLDSYVGRTPR